MIVGTAFCPQPPLLVPAVASGAAPELDALRAACRAAIRAVCQDGRVLLIGGGRRNRAHPAGTRGSLSPFGVDLGVALGDPDPQAPADLPASLVVGAWLVRDALGGDAAVTAWETADGTAPPPPEQRCGLVVMGDGSARRSTTAPGYLDDRAAGFDAAVVHALAGGDPAELGALDAELGSQLLAAGVPAWHAAATLLDGRLFRADVAYDDAPYGVGYVAARWLADA